MIRSSIAALRASTVITAASLMIGGIALTASVATSSPSAHAGTTACTTPHC